MLRSPFAISKIRRCLVSFKKSRRFEVNDTIQWCNMRYICVYETLPAYNLLDRNSPLEKQLEINTLSAMTVMLSAGHGILYDTITSY